MIFEIERGRRFVYDVWVVSRIATALAIPASKFGFGRGFDRAIGRAVDHFTVIDPGSRMSGGTSFAATLLAFRGAAHYWLGMPDRDQRGARRVVALLRQGVDAFGSDYARARGLYLPYLAGSHAIVGDTDIAVTVGHQAVDAVTAVSSPSR